MTQELKQIFSYLENKKDYEIQLLGIQLFRTHPIYQIFKDRYFPNPLRRNRYAEKYVDTSGKSLLDNLERMFISHRRFENGIPISLNYYTIRMIKRWIKNYNHKCAVNNFQQIKINN